MQKAELTIEDFAKNKGYLEELRTTKEKYEDVIDEIDSRYTHNQKVLTRAYNIYIADLLSYKIGFLFAFMLLSPIVIVLGLVTDYTGLNFKPMISLGMVGIVALVWAIYGSCKVRTYKKIRQ